MKFWTSNPGDSISSNPEGPALRRRYREEPGYIELLIKENQISQVKEFSAFLCMGRCRSVGSLKSFLPYALQLSRANILCFSHPELPWGSPWGVAVVWWLLDHRYSSLSWVPLGFSSAHWRATMADDCDILAYWYGRKYSISHLVKAVNVKNIYTVWFQLYDILEKSKTVETLKRLAFARDWGWMGGEMNRQNTEDFKAVKKYSV